MGYSDWEWEFNDKELMSGWWAQYTREGLVRSLELLTDEWDNDLVPEINTLEWGELVVWMQGGEDINEYPYWEGADSIIVPLAHDDGEEVVMHLLENYAKSLNETQETELEING